METEDTNKEWSEWYQSGMDARRLNPYMNRHQVEPNDISVEELEQWRMGWSVVEMAVSTAYERGSDSYDEGDGENPYDYGEIEYDAWNEGYDESRANSMENDDDDWEHDDDEYDDGDGVYA